MPEEDWGVSAEQSLKKVIYPASFRIPELSMFFVITSTEGGQNE
jgi:hypothetical protein